MFQQAISKLILGTVQFGLNYGINNTSGKPTQQLIDEMLLTAFNAGIRCLDTAEAYGDAHAAIGNFHKQNPSIAFDVITKLPHHIDQGIDQKLDKYLKDLNVNQLQGLLFHSYQTYKDNTAAMEVLNKFKQQGKVKYLGVSIYTNAQMEDVIADKFIDIIQLPFNLLDNQNLRGNLIAKAKQQNKMVHTRSAFLQGLFFCSIDDQRKIVQSLNNELQYINQISNNTNLTIQKIALNYCLQQPDIDNVLIGIDNLTQLNQNIADADNSLPAEVINDINLIKVANVELLNPSLWN